MNIFGPPARRRKPKPRRMFRVVIKYRHGSVFSPGKVLTREYKSMTRAFKKANDIMRNLTNRGQTVEAADIHKVYE